MDTQENTQRPAGQRRRTPRFIDGQPPAQVHDLLVMSHGPGTHPDDRANHACLNSLASNSWIMEAGGRPKTIPGRK